MPAFSQQSKDKLATCHPELQALFNEVVRHWDCSILEGHRNQHDQDEAFANGKSKLKWPHGKHNALPSLAVDVAPYPIPNWNNLEDFIYFGGFVMGIAQMLKERGVMQHSIRYGGDFNRNQRISDSSFEDLLHFEIDGV